VSKLDRVFYALTGRDANLGSMLGENSRSYRSGRGNSPVVSQETALKNSVWWACLRLRASVESSFPVDVIRRGADGLDYSVNSPGVLFTEPFPGQDISEFIYSARIDKDRYGNAVGIIRSRNAMGLPTSVELQEMRNCRAVMDGQRIKQWRIGGQLYATSEVWHERQWTLPGWDLGLSPLAYAASTMGIYQSTQEFALDWFANGAQPRGTLKNVKRDKIPANVREDVKRQFKASTEGGDIFVSGAEWEWNPATTSAATSGFLSQKSSSERDVCRYLDVPASMIDVEITTGNVTYGSVNAFDLQFLALSMGPAVARTQNYWSRVAMPKPWKFRMNTDALIRMDPQGKADLMVKLRGAMLRTPDELRALDNLPPYTPDQIEQLGTFAALQKPASTASADRKVSTS
jgi:HK97 family phage portal protein